VQTKINAVINGGTLIGNNVFVGPGAMVTGEIQPDAKLF